MHELRLTTLSHSGSQAEPDWQWIRVCSADSGADLCDYQWPSHGWQACNCQLRQNDSICASDGQQFISSNLKLRSTLNRKLGWGDCNKSMRGIQAVAAQLNNSPHWLPSTLAMARPEEVEHLAPGAPNPRHPAALVPWSRINYHEIRDFICLRYQTLMKSECNVMPYRVISWPKSWVIS